MKRLLTPVVLFALSLILWNCKDDDNPAPDLSSASIKFLWDFDADPNYTFFAVISDTSGNVLKWDEIVPGTELTMPYPPDEKLANVTLIAHGPSKTGMQTNV